MKKMVTGLGLMIREDFAGSLSGTHDWIRLTHLVTAPPGANQVRVLLYTDEDSEGSGRAWFDDVTLRRFGRNR